MKSRFVEDGELRLRNSPEFQARLRDLRKSIRARHAAELAEAPFLRRCLLRWRIAAEYRNERKRISPSPYALYATPFADKSVSDETQTP